MSVSRIRNRALTMTLMIVLCAPESTNALTGTLFTEQWMYSMCTCPNDSGVYSSALLPHNTMSHRPRDEIPFGTTHSMFSWMFCSRISSSMRRCASTSKGSAFIGSIEPALCARPNGAGVPIAPAGVMPLSASIISRRISARLP
jgi:hypothetical protein